MRQYDLLIKNGRLIDGTGNPWRYADVAISDGRIAAVFPARTQKLTAQMIIDAEGYVVTPGFVDVHSHADFSLLDDPQSPYFIKQGLTTLIIGNCGHSVTGKGADQVRDYWYRQGLITERQANDTRTWDSLSEYRKLVKDQGGLGFWAGVLLGHGTIRMAVVGPTNRPATKAELAEMKDIVRQGMEEGALGLSTGLDYQPGRFAHTDELIELAQVVADFGGTYATHTRGTPQGKDMLPGIREAITIGKQAGVKVQISHVSKQALHGQGIRLIEEARSHVVDVACDAIPYGTFFAVGSDHLLLSLRAGAEELFMKDLAEVREILRDKTTRKRVMEKARLFKHYQPDKTILIYTGNPKWEGKTVAEVARQTGSDYKELLIDLMVEECRSAVVCPIIEQSAEVAAVPDAQLKHPAVLMGTDAGPVDPQDPLGWFSPQGSGATLRYLQLAELHGVPLEESIRKLTSMACQRFGLSDRGIIAPGKTADILVFDPQNLKEVVDWTNPYAPPEGMRHVLVGGKPVVFEDRLTGLTPGTVLNRPTSG